MRINVLVVARAAMVCLVALVIGAEITPAWAQAGIDRNQAFYTLSGAYGSGTISSVGATTPPVALRGEFNLTVSAGGGGWLYLERSFDAGSTWSTCLIVITASVSDGNLTGASDPRQGFFVTSSHGWSATFKEPEAGVLYRLRAATGNSIVFTFSAQPAAGSTVTLNGLIYTFVTTTPTSARQVLIGGSVGATMTNLAASMASYLGLLATASAGAVTVVGNGAETFGAADASANAAITTSMTPVTYRISQ